MRLLVQEYLTMLKEDNELESVVLDLITSMGLNIISAPQKGVRQDGVDVHAVGIDPEDKIKKNFLITIKKGNIDRGIWDAPKQGVRPSLNEIIDAYIPTKISLEDKKLPIKIVLCCGGELKQELQINWTGFQSNNSNFQFALWNGNKLSALIEDHLLDENIFIENVRKYMRRTLTLLSDHNYELSHFKLMIDNLLFNEYSKQTPSNKNERLALKALSTIPVCLGMLYEYSVENKNLKHPLIASEHCLLRCWDFILKNDLKDNQKVLTKFYQILNLYYKYGAEYFKKLEPHCLVKDGITLNCRNTVAASEVVFEQIGLISSLGIFHFIFGISVKESQGLDNSKVLSETLKKLISNNSISASPSFDEMTIDITLGFYLLALHEENEFIKDWIDQLIHRFSFSYLVLGRGFPISQDSIEILIEFEKDKEHSKEEMVSTSNLLATIAYWCAVLNLNEQYERLISFVDKNLSNSTLQIWFPEKGIKAKLYSDYAGDEFGITEAPIDLPKTLKELKSRLNQFLDFSKTSDNFEIMWNDSPPALPLIASRHFRTPVIPFFWLRVDPEISEALPPV